MKTYEIFGTEYPNSPGVRAMDNNGVYHKLTVAEGTLNITENGTNIDVGAYAAVNVSVQGAPDGNNLGYGLTDGTLPLVGVAKVGSAVI